MTPNPKQAMHQIADQLRFTLDDSGVERLKRLIASEDDWDGQGAKALSLTALVDFQSFLKQVQLEVKTLGLFLGFDGALIVSSQAPNGSGVDLAFLDGFVEYCSSAHEHTYCVHDPALLLLFEQPSGVGNTNN